MIVPEHPASLQRLSGREGHAGERLLGDGWPFAGGKR